MGAISSSDKYIVTITSRLSTRKGEGAWPDEVVPLERDDLYITQANVFLDAVEGCSSPLCSLQEGVQALKANLAMLASVKSGKWQTL